MKCLLKGKIYTRTSTESELDSCFRTAPFFIDDCGFLPYVRKDLACRELKRYKPPNDVERIVTELN